MRFVSVVVPDWLTAIASVSVMSRRIPNPDSSVAVIASTSSWPSVSSSRIAAVLWPATAAVPWPITRIRVIVPSARRSAMSAAERTSPTSALSTPSRSTILPRRVLAKLSGASVISLSRKCGASPRLMSRVVTSAVTTSSSVDRVVRCRRTPNRCDTVERRRRCRPTTTTISPPCSPSMRTYAIVSSTTPYGSLATIVAVVGRARRTCP